jgi:hypothetical protein
MLPPSAHSYIHLPPTEWGDTETRVRLHFDAGGYVASLGLSIVYGPHPRARGAIQSFFETKLGLSESSEDLLGDRTLRFPGTPNFELKDDDIAAAWDLRVSDGP